MNFLIVASKFPPEYSGPGVRIPRLYDAIANRIGIKSIYVYCNGIEQSSNEDYIYNGYQVRRRTMAFLRSFPPFLPQRIRDSMTYFLETIQGLWGLQHYADKNISHIHLIGHSGGTAAALWWANRKNIPVLMELVTASAAPCQKFLLLGKICPPQNCSIVALTHEAEERCRKAGFQGDQIWQRPNPIDESVYQPEFDKRVEYRSRLSPFRDDDVVICSVAKMMPQKNQILLVEALRFLPPRFKLLIAGPKVSSGQLQERDDDYIHSIQKKIENYALKDRVHLVYDFVKSNDYMKASDIYALPAWDEGFGTPMMEALACGLPVVANQGETAFREWIRNGENGFLCDIGAPEAWADAFLKASEFSPETRLKEAAHIHKEAGQKNIYDAYIRLIQKLVTAEHH